jgi:hypothetical protein
MFPHLSNRPKISLTCIALLLAYDNVHLVIFVAKGWQRETVPKCGEVKVTYYHLTLGPIFGSLWFECPHPWALPSLTHNKLERVFF